MDSTYETKKEKVAVITGAKSGIGLATTLRFADEGAKVVAADIVDTRQEVDEIAKRGTEAVSVRVDVSDETQVITLIEKMVATFGRLDILVNNAGMQLTKKITDTSEAEWDRLMNINLKGVFLCSKAAIPVMRINGEGVIVNVSSELGVVGGSEMAAYSASKGGVVQLTKSMAIDYAEDGIRVNCIAPGPVATPMLEAIIKASSNFKEARRSIVERTLLKRLARPEEIANVISFMASDESSYMTGSVVMVDGGWTAQ